MPKGSSGPRLKTHAPRAVNASNEQKASAAVVRALSDYKMLAATHFPDLQGQIYSQLNKLVQADYSNANVAGYYSPSAKKISVANKIVGDREQLRDTVAHELGHALSINPPRGFNSIDDTFTKAFREYRKTHKTATEQSFAKSISAYAGKARAEAFAEAFADYLRNGKNAKKASRLLMESWRGKS